MFVSALDDTYLYRFRGKKVDIVVYDDCRELDSADIIDIIFSSDSAAMSALVNTFRKINGMPLLKPYVMMCNKINPDVSYLDVQEMMKFSPRVSGPGLPIAKVSLHKNVFFNVDIVQPSEIRSINCFDLSIDHVIDTCRSSNVIIHGKNHHDWLRTEYRNHVEEAAPIFAMCTTDDVHREFSAGISTIQPIANIVGSVVYSCDIDNEVCRDAESVGHDVLNMTNEEMQTKVLNSDVLWACYTTDDCPMLPQQLATKFPDNRIVVIDTNHFFKGLEMYTRLSSRSNVYVRNLIFTNNLAKKWKASNYTWTNFVVPEKIYHVTDDYAYDLLLYNQRITNVPTVCFFNDKYGVNFVSVVAVTEDAIDVYHSSPSLRFYKHFYIPYGVYYEDSSRLLTMSSLQIVEYGCTLLVDPLWRVNGLPDNNVVLQQIKLKVITPNAVVSIVVVPFVPCDFTDELLVTQRFCKGARDYVIKGVRMTPEQLELSRYK